MGLAAAVLELLSADALDGGAPLLLLHAAPPFRTYYSRLGYSPAPPIPTSLLPLRSLPPSPPPPPLRRVHGAESLRLLAPLLSSLYSPPGLSRPRAYWPTWYRADALRWGAPGGSGFAAITEGRELKAFAVLRIEGGCGGALGRGERVEVQVRDFHAGVGEDRGGRLRECAEALLERECGVRPGEGGEVVLKLPRVAADEGWGGEEGEADEGWMWKGTWEGEREWMVWPCDSW
ncbi:hypothetical protein TeGR_g2897 [Tetraparma gracilis]|uniref:N-acetyltransferase domain-containing protein n=1 Tax=Tetraparma gracilis TaxID=2962635 RepID=A0ABQ6MHN5_9STRA|nr:hypothetical protein TeGR_g2897 [Tetraparma gracilis]